MVRDALVPDSIFIAVIYSRAKPYPTALSRAGADEKQEPQSDCGTNEILGEFRYGEDPMLSYHARLLFFPQLRAKQQLALEMKVG